MYPKKWVIFGLNFGYIPKILGYLHIMPYFDRKPKWFYKKPFKGEPESLIPKT